MYNAVSVVVFHVRSRRVHRTAGDHSATSIRMGILPLRQHAYVPFMEQPTPSTWFDVVYVGIIWHVMGLLEAYSPGYAVAVLGLVTGPSVPLPA